jgi:alpha-1,3-mannosyltransferase
VHRVPYAGSHRYPIAPRVLRRLAGFDIIHVHAVDSLVDMLAWTRAFHRRPLVLSTHGGFFHTGFAQRLKRLYFATVTRASLAGVRAVISSSLPDQERFAPLWPEKTVLVENGVDTARFRGLARPGTRRIIYFGRIAPNKQVDRLLAWFAALQAREPGWALIIAGRPMGITLDELREDIARRGLEDAVELVASPDDEALRGLIARASVYACASSYEGFGIAAVEAASAGLYPVLSTIPAFARTRERLGFGTLVDFAAAEPAIDGFLADLERFERAVPEPETLDAQLAPFGWIGAVERIGAIYERVLGRRARRIGAVDVAVMDRAAALAAMLDAVARRRPQIIAFCNAHTVNVAERDPVFAATLEKALVLNDGIGLGIASTLLYGRRFPTNLNGTNLLPELIGRLPAGTRLFLVGSQPGIAQRAAAVLGQHFPDIVIAGTEHGFFGAEDEAALGERIAAAAPDLVLAGMGQPRQELWASRNADRLGVPVICVGAFLDFAAGKVPRAPALLQRIGLEWAFRLAMEPRRLAGRYLIGNVTFLTRLAAQWASGRRGLD